MRKMLLFLMSFLFIGGLSNKLLAQWAENKNAREDAIYVRVMQANEDVVVDGVEDAVWAEADSIVVGYGQTSYLPGSGYDLWAGTSVPGDSANAVFKCLYKAPYIYLLFKVEDESVGGWNWDASTSGFDAIIMAFKDNTGDHSWVQAWDKRMEHFFTWGYHWAFPDSFPNPNDLHGAPPLYMGNNSVAGGREEWRTPAQQERWTAVTTVNGTSMDSLPDMGWISEHRINVDSLGFNLNRMGDVLPFSFSMFDADRIFDSTASNNSWNRTWWGCPWNENWYYGALFIDPNVTTATMDSPIPPVDYTIPRLRESETITTDGDLNEWQTDNTLHFHVKYGDESTFTDINGTGDWASGYLEDTWNSSPTVVDGPEVDYWITYDDSNLYVSATVTDQIVTVPDPSGRKDGITFFMVPRNYVNGAGIFPSKTLTVNVDSSGNGVAADDLIGMVDTANVDFALMLGDQTDVNDNSNFDNGFTVELKLPFTSFSYPEDLGDSVVFIGALVNDIDVFDDANSNYYAKTFWFVQQPGQHAPAWVVLGPPNSPDAVNDEAMVPTTIKLLDNYPNPFNPSTTIKYSININSDVTLFVYNILGQTVSEMKQLNVPIGYNEFKFDATGLSSGVYFYQLKISNHSNLKVTRTQVKKMVLLK